MKKFAFISLGLPPSQSGQSLAVYHLLREFDPAAYCLVTLKNFHLYNCLGNSSKKLKVPLHFVHPDYQVVRVLVAAAAKLRLRFVLSLLLKLRICQYKRIIRAERCSLVIGCTGDLLDPPAAFFASRALDLPFILYAFDYYSRQWPDSFLRSFADEQEKTIVHGATGIIVPNECLGREFRQRYGAHPVVIHNPFDLSEYEKNTGAFPGAERDPAEKTIVYTGAVYEAHYGAFRNLIAAIARESTPRMKSAAIIGVSSMLGRELSAQLCNQGITIIGIGRSPCHDIVFDLAEPLSRDICAGQTADVVFHCASAFAGDDLAGAHTNFQTNALGCLNVLSLMEQLKCSQVVYAGSVSSYRGFEVPNSFSSYGLSKAEGEQILEWGMTRKVGVFCSLRFSQLYDTEGLCCTHQPWFGRIIAYASHGLDLRLPLSMGPRNFLHVSDAARLIIRAAEINLNGCWPACHTESLDIYQIAEIAYREFGRGGRIVIDSKKKPFRSVSYPSDLSLFEHLQDKPQISMAEGIAMIHRNNYAEHFGPMDVQ